VTALERVPDYNPANPFDAARPTTTAVVRSDQFERMANWLDLFMRTAEVAKVLARTAFVPDAMRGQPEDIAAAMMRSLELGIDPLDGLANLHVIKGRVGYSAEFMRRRILEAGHEFEFLESTDERCKIRGRRNGSGEWQTVVFTADQARKAKINLGEYPSDKLVARASSRLCRRVFPDVLAGATILEDVIDVDGEEVKQDDSRPAAVQRKRQPRKVTSKPVEKPEPADVDDLLDEPGRDGGNDVSQGVEPSSGTIIARDSRDQYQQGDLLDDGDAAQPSDEPITKPQLQKLSILRQREGYADDDDGRADWFRWVEVNIGRRVGTNKDLTKAEASVLIDVLESAQAQDGRQ
jgi:hypothetical protein